MRTTVLIRKREREREKEREREGEKDKKKKYMRKRKDLHCLLIGERERKLNRTNCIQSNKAHEKANEFDVCNLVFVLFRESYMWIC